MADILCGYTADRDETLVAYLYNDLDPAQHAAFEAHAATCERCRSELAELKGARAQLQHWAAPESVRSLRPRAVVSAHASRDASVWTALGELPTWAQVAAALLFLGMAGGIANLDVRYDRNGLSMRTGWLRTRADAAPDLRSANAADTVHAQTAATVSPATAPWRADVDTLERRLRAEFHGTQSVNASVAPTLTRTGSRAPAAAADMEILKRVRALMDDSERRQQRELALRVAEVIRDVNAQRQSDLVRIDQRLGFVQNNTGIEVAKQRELLNYLVRVSSQK